MGCAVAGNIGRARYTAKVLAFLPSAMADQAAEAVLGAAP
jgi:hypothetical protein